MAAAGTSKAKLASGRRNGDAPVTTPGRAAMNTNDPTLLRLEAAARAYAMTRGSSPHSKLRVRIDDLDVGEEIARLRVLPMRGPDYADDQFEPAPDADKIADRLSAKQKRILLALIDGPLKGDQLAKDSNLASRTALYQGRGLSQLIDADADGSVGAELVVNNEDAGYTLTPLGVEVAEVVQGT